jgi:transposase-like protein
VASAGKCRFDVPRDRDSSFEPQLVRKGQTRFDGLDENIISLYARGMTQREIQGHLEELYGVEVFGMWAAEAEGAKFWMQVVMELKNRGVCDIFIACVDGLKGFPKPSKRSILRRKSNSAWCTW